MNGQATSPGSTIHAAQGVTVVLTVGVDDARIPRSVAIQGLPPKGAPSPDGVAEGALTTSRCAAGHKITYAFAADRPGTITYYARYDSRARIDAGHDVRGSRSHARPSARRRARIDAGHGLDTVPRRDEGPAADSRAGRLARIAVPLPRGRRGVACVEAQLMADCPVIYYNDKEYDGGDQPFQRLLRWSAAALAGICGLRDPDVRRRGDGPLNVRFGGGRANPHVSRAPYFTPP